MRKALCYDEKRAKGMYGKRVCVKPAELARDSSKVSQRSENAHVNKFPLRTLT